MTTPERLTDALIDCIGPVEARKQLRLMRDELALYQHQQPKTTKGKLTPKQCAEQFRLYAKSHPSKNSQHSLKFCADFLDEECVQFEQPSDSVWLCKVLSDVEADISKWPNWLRKAAGVCVRSPRQPSATTCAKEGDIIGKIGGLEFVSASEAFDEAAKAHREGHFGKEQSSATTPATGTDTVSTVDPDITLDPDMKAVRRAREKFEAEHPSITPERKDGDAPCPVTLEKLPEGSVAPKGSTPAAATTPDVEKLEWKLWPQSNNKVIVYQNNEIESIITPEAVSSEQGELLRRKHNRALAQARAPLIRALNRLLILVDANQYEQARKVVDAALTSTEDKSNDIVERTSKASGGYLNEID